MDIKTDINNRNDIEKFIITFYENVKLDTVIGIIFNEIFPIRWEHHIPLITDFWESILFNNPVYKHNAMAIHFSLNKIYPLQQKHFDSWLNIFNSTINTMYKEPVCDLVKKESIIHCNANADQNQH